MKIRGSDFKQKMYEAVQNTFKTQYWDTHCKEDKTEHSHSTEQLPIALSDASFKNMLGYLGGDQPAKIDVKDTDGFVKHIYYDFDVIKRYIVKKNNYLTGEINSISGQHNRIDCLFAPEMTFHTTNNGGYVSHSVTHDVTVENDYAQMHIEVGNKISNTWTCPATGNLVVYGWLDSSSILNNKAIPSAYCVLEAFITGNGIQSNKRWEIISAQPVIPAKSITYVGFNVPVHKGLMIRARTGFIVGAKSSQFSNEQDGNDTLSNSVENGFKCMIFSNASYNQETDS